MRLTGIVLIAARAVFSRLATWKSRAQQPKFEVASIKPAGDDQPMMVFGPELRNGTLLGQKVTLRIMLAVAFGRFSGNASNSRLISKIGKCLSITWPLPRVA